jgi:hypothetical protein
MEKKKFSIELPKGGRNDLARRTISKPRQEPPVEATEWQRFIHYLIGKSAVFRSKGTLDG